MIHMAVTDRPALKELISAMERLSRPKRTEIARIGRKAKAAKIRRIRRLTSQACAEAKRLAGDRWPSNTSA
jgi:hypothetical protein